MSSNLEHTRFDCHMHTPLCGHAYGDPLEYVEQAAFRGISLITFSCHIPMNGRAYSQEGIRMRHEDIPRYREIVDEAREYGTRLGVEVLYGIEAEITPEASELEQMSALIEAESFDFVLGSVHHMMPIWDQLRMEKDIRTDRDRVRHYFEELAAGAETGLYDSIAHPDVIRLYGTLSGPFLPEDHEGVIKETLDRIAASHTCLEINTSGLIKGDFTVHPDPVIMQWALDRGIAFTIGSDSHIPDRVGDGFEEVIEDFREMGLSELSYFRQRKRIAVQLRTPASSRG